MLEAAKKKKKKKKKKGFTKLTYIKMSQRIFAHKFPRNKNLS